MTISVIIPTFNRAALIPQTLDSVLTQTRLPEEVLVVDDGSTDDTQSVVAAFVGAHGGRVRYQRQENGGPSSARNLGMRLTTGEAVCFLDSDDLLRPRALECLEAALGAFPDAPLAYSRAEMLSQGGESLGPWTPGGGYHAGEVWGDLLRDNFIRSPGAALIRRAALEAAGPWDEATRRNEDWEMWLRLAEQGPLVLTDDTVFLYRVHGGSVSQDIAAMYRESQRMYRKLRRRYQAGSSRRAALEAVLRDVRAAEPLYLLSLARLDLRRWRPVAAMAKAARAVLLNPLFLVDPRVARHLRREAQVLKARREPHVSCPK